VKKWLVGGGILLAILAGWGWSHHENAANEHALASVASELAGRPVGVQCQGFWAALLDVNGRAGDVQFPAGRSPDHMFLTRGICGELKAFRTASSHHDLDCLLAVDWQRWSPEADSGDPCAKRAQPAAEAINTLTHESMHLRGFVDEAQTQCYAIQLDAWTTVRLGGTLAQGAAVARFVLALQPLLSSEYQSSECRSGGSLDLHPETAAFPTESPPSLPSPSLRGPALVP
jgi:hypothetical protein